MLNPYLQHLTSGERNLGWLWTMLVIWLILWIVSCALIWAGFLDASLEQLYEILALVGLPLSLLSIAAGLTVFVFVGANLTFAEAHGEPHQHL